MSVAWARGSTRAWRRARLIVLARDGYTCQLHLPGCTIEASQVHHTQGKSAGDAIAGLIAACAPCNLAVGDPTRHDPIPRKVTQW